MSPAPLKTLLTAIQLNDTGYTLDRLKEESYVRAITDDPKNEVLILAANKGNLEILEALLKIPAVKEKAHVQNNKALWDATRGDRLEVVKKLLSVPSVQAALSRQDIESLCRTKTLLPIVTKAFWEAVNDARWKVVEEFLRAPSVQAALELQDIAYLYRKKKTLLPIAIEQYKYFGIPLQKYIDSRDPDVSTKLKGLSDDPLQFFEKEKLPALELEALRILFYAQKVKYIEEKIVNKLLGDEGAMEESLVKRADDQFNKVVKPNYQSAFERYGANDVERLQNIEKSIRSCILKKIKEEAAEINNDALVQFIDKNFEALTKGEDSTLMQEARKKFTSTTSAAQNAWRGYDKAAPVRGEWDNLLTPQSGSKNIYVAESSDAADLPADKASNMIRERVAYYYLAVTDESYPKEKESRIANFIGCLSDIRRTHNTPDDPFTQDDPSCFPGTITRIANMGNFHPKVALPIIMDPEDILMTILTPKICSIFSTKIKELRTLEEKQKLFLALTMLSTINAQGVINGENIFKGSVFEDSDEKEMLEIRNAFRKELPDASALFKALKKQLAVQSDKHWLKALIEHRLSNIGGKDVVFALQGILDREMPKKPHEKTEENNIQNPFIISENALKKLPPERQRNIKKKNESQALLWDKIYETLKDTFPDESKLVLSVLAKDLTIEYYSETQTKHESTVNDRMTFFQTLLKTESGKEEFFFLRDTSLRHKLSETFSSLPSHAGKKETPLEEPSSRRQLK